MDAAGLTLETGVTSVQPGRPRMDADIVCVGFGPATAGFLSTLSKQLVNADGTPAVESASMPGLPPQVLCYERADDIGAGSHVLQGEDTGVTQIGIAVVVFREHVANRAVVSEHLALAG